MRSNVAQTRRSPARAASRARALGLALVLLASMLPAPAAAANLASVPIAASIADGGDRDDVALTGGGQASGPAGGASAEPVDPADPGLDLDPDPELGAEGDPAQTPDPSGGVVPTVHFLDEQAHARERFEFEAGDAVTAPFSPRAGDRWEVDGKAPRPLPPGHATGRQMREAAQDSAWANGRPSDLAIDRRAASQGWSGGIDQPIQNVSALADPASILGARLGTAAAGTASGGAVAAAPVSSTGLRREIFGFLPYWELSDSSTTLDWRTLSTVAYFSVGCNGNGTLQKKNTNGTLTTGWAGWTSKKMTSLITAAHEHQTRVVLTVSCFAWSSSGASIQASLLRSATARATLAKQIAAAVRDRGADGANLDFEPIVAGYADEFTALVRKVRSELNNVAPGYQLTFDAMGSVGNQPIAAATAPGGADAVFIMGYDYRTAGTAYAGSHAPLTGPIYDLTDTVKAFSAKVSPSKLILGVPYYGRAWSTSSNALHAKNISGTKYGGSAEPSYAQAIDIATANGRRWDSVEQAPWTAYRKQTCTSQYGCVTSWRELYYDDAQSLKLKYDLVNRQHLRGAGIWALGYDNARSELRNALADKFLSDRTAPVTGITTLGQTQRDEGFKVSWKGYDDSGIAGFDIDVSVNGAAWARWLNNTRSTSGLYLGRNGSTYAFRARARDIHGNTSAWNSSINLASLGVPGAIVPGGFATVLADDLRMRMSPTTSASVMTTLPRGSALRVLAGPVAAEGYSWYQVSGPVRQWGPVDAMQVGGWVAARGNGVVNAAPRRPIYATTVVAGITGVRLNGGGERVVTPNGDGRQDVLRIEWTNHGSFDSIALRLHRSGGGYVGSVSLGATGSGAHAYSWNGRIGGTLVPAGAYVIEVRGMRGSTPYSAPSASPATPAQVARFGVYVGPAAPTSVVSFTTTPGSPTRSGNVTFTLKFGAGITRLDRNDLTRSGSAAGCSMAAPTGSGTTWSIAVTGCGAGTVTVTLRAKAVMDAVSNWGPQANVARTVRIDRTAPTAASPRVRLRTGATLSSVLTSAALPATLSWSASDAGGAGIRDYDVRRSVDGGAFVNNAVDHAAPTMGIGLTPGHSYRFAVRATDKAGNVGAWVAGPVMRGTLLQDPSGALTFRGTWAKGTSVSYSGGTVRFSKTAGSAVRYAFTGRGIALVATRGPDRGAVKVYLDGTLVATVDTRADALQFRSVVWSRSWASSGSHTLRLVVVGTSVRPRVDLDALEVLR
jgi:spore germination protein YaaH